MISAFRRTGIFKFLPAALIYGLILYGSSRSPELLAQIGLKFPDFIGHFLEYLLLSLALQPLFRKNRRLLAPGFWILLGTLAALDEGFQALVPGRLCSLADWAVDLAGGTAGRILYLLFTPSRTGSGS